MNDKNIILLISFVSEIYNDKNMEEYTVFKKRFIIASFIGKYINEHFIESISTEKLMAEWVLFVNKKNELVDIYTRLSVNLGAQNETIVDLGSGIGIWQYLGAKSRKIIAVDSNESVINFNKLLWNTFEEIENTNIQHKVICKYISPTDSELINELKAEDISCLICIGVLHELPFSIKIFLDQIQSILKPNAKIIIGDIVVNKFWGLIRDLIHNFRVNEVELYYSKYRLSNELHSRFTINEEWVNKVSKIPHGINGKSSYWMNIKPDYYSSISTVKT